MTRRLAPTLASLSPRWQPSDRFRASATAPKGSSCATCIGAELVLRLPECKGAALRATRPPPNSRRHVDACRAALDPFSIKLLIDALVARVRLALTYRTVVLPVHPPSPPAVVVRLFDLVWIVRTTYFLADGVDDEFPALTWASPTSNLLRSCRRMAAHDATEACCSDRRASLGRGLDDDEPVLVKPELGRARLLSISPGAHPSTIFNRTPVSPSPNEDRQLRRARRRFRFGTTPDRRPSQRLDECTSVDDRPGSPHRYSTSPDWAAGCDARRSSTGRRGEEADRSFGVASEHPPRCSSPSSHSSKATTPLRGIVALLGEQEAHRTASCG